MGENNFIKHAFVSSKSDGPDSTLVRPSNWNDGLVFAGGINGQVLVYDNTQDNNMRWVDGSNNYAQGATISNPTTSPYVNVIDINFTSNSPINIVVSTLFFSVTTVGSVNFTMDLKVDGVSTANFPIASGATITSVEIESKTTGAHRVQLDMTSVGNANFTAGIIQATVLTIGK